MAACRTARGGFIALGKALSLLQAAAPVGLMLCLVPAGVGQVPAQLAQSWGQMGG